MLALLCTTIILHVICCTVNIFSKTDHTIISFTKDKTPHNHKYQLNGPPPRAILFSWNVVDEPSTNDKAFRFFGRLYHSIGL